MFVKTQLAVDRLVEQFAEVGVRAGALHGGKTQRVRTRTLAEFREGRVDVLVATNVAARGIHVDGVSLVVHVDPPKDAKDYLHRAGRTARAGESGTVVTLVLPRQRRSTFTMLERAGVTPVRTEVTATAPALAEVTGARSPSGVPGTGAAAAAAARASARPSTDGPPSRAPHRSRPHGGRRQPVRGGRRGPRRVPAVRDRRPGPPPARPDARGSVRARSDVVPPAVGSGHGGTTRTHCSGAGSTRPARSRCSSPTGPDCTPAAPSSARRPGAVHAAATSCTPTTPGPPSGSRPPSRAPGFVRHVPAGAGRRPVAGHRDRAGRPRRRAGRGRPRPGRPARHRRPGPAGRGALDVDLGSSPLTNTLPIRRLGLLSAPAGTSHTITAAWVLVPSLEVIASEQTYTVLGDGRLRYASGSLHGRPHVDAHGLRDALPWPGRPRLTSWVGAARPAPEPAVRRPRPPIAPQESSDAVTSPSRPSVTPARRPEFGPRALSSALARR